MDKRQSARQEALELIHRYGEDILQSEEFRKAMSTRHHLRYTVSAHTLYVTENAIRIWKWLDKHGIHADLRDTVRASLLHDIGMTDDSVHDSPSYKKAYSHPVRSREIAKAQFEINDVQADAIAHHMWPVCVIPPRHLPGWIVIAADKYCSLREMAKRRKNFEKHLRSVLPESLIQSQTEEPSPAVHEQTGASDPAAAPEQKEDPDSAAAQRPEEPQKDI